MGEEARKKESSIARALDRYVRQIEGLSRTFPLADLQLTTTRKTGIGELVKFLAKHSKEVEDKDGKRVVVDADRFYEYGKLVRRVKQLGLATDTVPRSVFVSMVSTYDAFLGNLLREVFLLRPELLEGSDRSLSLKELMRFDSIESARAALVEKEIESVLRKSHADQFAWMENRFSMKLRVNLTVWPTFIEMTERRNLFVHTDGIVSSQYLQICAEHGVTIPTEVKAGSRLGVPRAYFETANRCVFEIGVKLAHVLWRKFDDQSRADADKNLNTIGYELIEDERYDLAQTILDFGVAQKEHSDEHIRRFMVLNQAQAYRWAGDTEKCETILGGEDWSACDDVIRLGLVALKDEESAIMTIMKRLGADHQHIGKAAYRDWPIFKLIRQRDVFANEFMRIFGEPLHKVTESPEGMSDSADP